jgi:DNA-directed RNA polymerase sigma subunit (sigma70/sigma32)
VEHWSVQGPVWRRVESDAMGLQPGHSTGDDAVIRDLRRQAFSTPPLQDAEAARLLEQAARGDGASQDRLVAANLGMVIRLAEQRREKGLSVPDLVQEGSLGLVEAVKTFSTSGQASFMRFAETKVGQQMDAAIDAEAAAVREGELLVAAATDYERTQLLLRRELQRDATEAEIAEKLEWSVERTRYVAQVVAEARRRHDEELLAFIDPDAVDVDDTIDGE